MSTALLPANDHDFITQAAPNAQIEVDGGMTCVVFPSFELPPGFTTTESDLLVRLGAGYPDVAPDMWWFSPAVQRTDGAAIPATEVTESVLGRSWQRWSRHFEAGVWLSGTDTLQSYIALIRTQLTAAAK